MLIRVIFGFFFFIITIIIRLCLEIPFGWVFSSPRHLLN